MKKVLFLLLRAGYLFTVIKMYIAKFQFDLPRRPVLNATTADN